MIELAIVVAAFIVGSAIHGLGEKYLRNLAAAQHRIADAMDTANAQRANRP